MIAIGLSLSATDILSKISFKRKLLLHQFVREKNHLTFPQFYFLCRNFLLMVFWVVLLDALIFLFIKKKSNFFLCYYR